MRPALPFPLEDFEQSVHADVEVLGMLYTGSLGRGTADRFSDLDIEVWVTDLAFEATRSKLDQILGYLGEVQFVYHSGASIRGFVRSEWRRVDLSLLRREALRPGPALANATVVKDTDEVLARLVADSPREQITASFEQVEAAMAEAIDSQIYLALHNARGAVWSAMGEVVYASTELYTLLARLRGRQSFGFRYVESLLTPDEHALLTAVWPTAPAKDEVRRAARELWAWTRHVWNEAEGVLGRSLDIKVSESALLAATDNIYTWE